MNTEKPKPDAFCETVIAWRHEEGTESPITDADHGCTWREHLRESLGTCAASRW